VARTSAAIDLSDCYRPASDVLARRLGEEVVLLDLRRGTYYGLDATGQRVWTLLQECATLGELVGRLAEEFEAPREVLAADVVELVDRLAGEGLVVLEASAGSAG
jgi:hypothetical protein